MHTSLQWPRQNITQGWYSQKTPHSSPMRVKYGVYIVSILEETDRVITAPHCSVFSLANFLWNCTEMDVSNLKSTLVLVMAWCRQATSHSLSQCWPEFMLPITWPWWVNPLRLRQNGHHFADSISNAFSWIKLFEFCLRFHWSLFPRVQFTIF